MLDFIVNLFAGGKNGKKVLNASALIKEKLEKDNIPFEFHFTEKDSKTVTITKELIEKGATDIIVIGGDGTLHQVINGFSNFENVNMGIIPSGTGNDFASALGLPEDPLKALDVILTETPKYTDYMQMPTVRGLNIIGMGLDVDVLKRYMALKKKTKVKYARCLVKSLLKFEYSDFDGEFNGKTEHYRSFIACIANGTRYGGGIEICPPAKIDDGKLDFAAIREMKKIKIIGAFLKLKKGKITSVKQYVHDTAKEIKITTPLPYTVNVDGELYDDIPFEVKVVHNQLKVYRK